jgi:hypothetical protein
LVIISYTTGLSFALERIGPLASITFIIFYLLVLYLLALPNTPETPFASIYSESLIKTTCQHLLLLVGFDTLIYRKYYDTPPILVGHQPPRWEKPKHPINFPETHCDPPPSSTQDRDGLEALPGTLPERGIATGGLLHRHACLWRDE